MLWPVSCSADMRGQTVRESSVQSEIPPPYLSTTTQYLSGPYSNPTGQPSKAQSLFHQTCGRSLHNLQCLWSQRTRDSLHPSSQSSSLQALNHPTDQLCWSIVARLQPGLEHKVCTTGEVCVCVGSDSKASHKSSHEMLIKRAEARKRERRW